MLLFYLSTSLEKSVELKSMTLTVFCLRLRQKCAASWIYMPKKWDSFVSASSDLRSMSRQKCADRWRCYKEICKRAIFSTRKVQRQSLWMMWDTFQIDVLMKKTFAVRGMIRFQLLLGLLYVASKVWMHWTGGNKISDNTPKFPSWLQRCSQSRSLPLLVKVRFRLLGTSWLNVV